MEGYEPTRHVRDQGGGGSRSRDCYLQLSRPEQTVHPPATFNSYRLVKIIACSGARRRNVLDASSFRMSPPRHEEGRCEATWKREFELPWREAGPPDHHGDEVDSDQKVFNRLGPVGCHQKMMK